MLALHRAWWGPLLAPAGQARAREEIRADCEDGLLVDLLLGACWSRLLRGHAQLDLDQAPAIVDAILDSFAVAAKDVP